MSVAIGMCTLELHIPEANSLKEKRSVVKSMLDGMRGRFNVSAAEVEQLDTWRRATIAVASVSNSRQFTDQVLNKVLDWVESNPRVQVASVEMEFL